MRWFCLVGVRRRQPRGGNWTAWKQQIADECNGQCVYCAIPEARFGGIRNFHVEHFRPKKKFEGLENEIANLYLACAICNVLKSDDWPADPVADGTVAAYPDPSVVDYNRILELSETNYTVKSQLRAGTYLIERVLLNRFQLVLERRLAALIDHLKKFTNWARDAKDTFDRNEQDQLIDVLLDIQGVMASVIVDARPYRSGDTRRSP